MIVFELLFYSIGGYLFVSTLMSFLRWEIWWVRIQDFPRLQSFWLQLIFGAMFIVFLFHNTIADYITLGCLLITASLQGYMILPYTSLVKKQVLPSSNINVNRKFTMLISNVLMTNRDATRLLIEIRKCDPDLIFCVETDAWWVDQLSVLKQSYPHSIEFPLNNTYGLALYSRLNLVDPQVKFLIQDDIPSVHAEVELPGGERFRFYGLHPRPPIPDESKTSSPRDAELVVVARDVQAHNAPCIVTGDMNDVGWSKTTKMFQKLSGLLDPRIGRGMYCTYNAKYLLFRWSLDHAFFSSHFRLSKLERLPGVGSDHFPLYFELSYEPEKKEQQETIHTDSDTEEQAEKKLRDMNV